MEDMFTEQGNDISIHSLRVEGDPAADGAGGCDSDFNPLPPCGGRPCPPLAWAWMSPFQSTPSVWRETFDAPMDFTVRRFQSTPSVWRETR